MRAYFAKLTPTAQMLLAIPVIAMAYPLVTIILPAVICAAIPEAMRFVLKMM